MPPVGVRTFLHPAEAGQRSPEALQRQAQLERMPGFPDAQAGLKRIKRPEKSEREASGGWLERLLGFFSGG